MYCVFLFFFFLRFSILQVLRFDIAVAIFTFCFLTLDHGEKLNDTLNIQTATIKTPILAVIFPVLFQLSVNINKQSQKFQ